MKKGHNVSLYRSIHHMRRGGLHRALGVSENETIPESKIEAATHSENEHIKRMANFAKTLKGFKK
jgi:hypothetical protein